MSEEIDLTQHPLPEEPAGWWAGRNEEILAVGPCDTKEQAIAEAIGSMAYRENDDGTNTIYVGMFVKQRINLAKYFDAESFLEKASEKMDEDGDGGDEYGDNNPCLEISEQATADLECVVREAIWKWQRDHGLHLRSWWMTSVKVDPEFVTVNSAGEVV